MDNNLMTINKVSKISGVTIRSLHYYDEINLLKPACFSKSGYRLYNDDNLKVLQQILFFKELDFSLKEIKNILNDKSYDEKKILTNHTELLILKRNRLNDLLRLLDKRLGGNTVSFKEFDISEIEKAQDKYTTEVKEKWGNSMEYKQSHKKTSNYTKDDWASITKESDDIFKEFAICMNLHQNKSKMDELVQKWQNHITKYYYECTYEILQSLADMYVYDERFKNNIDKHGDSLAEFISMAIKQFNP